MNTVLDDNMMLCLSNGERIKLKIEMRMLFEVQDLGMEMIRMMRLPVCIMQDVLSIFSIRHTEKVTSMCHSPHVCE